MIPMPIVTGLVSSAMGFFMKYLAKRQEIAKLQHQMQMEALTKVEASRERAASVVGPFVRRFIVVTAFFYLFIGRFIVALMWPDVPITMGYTETSGGWLFGLFGDSYDKMKFMDLKGYTILPLDVHVVMSIIGFYLGASQAK